MSLTVEDGSCIPAANALVSRAELIAFAAAYFPATTVTDDETTDAAILRASTWISNFPEWDGSKTCGRGLQGMAWPRTGVTDCNGDSIPDDEVPAEVKYATHLAALAEYSSPGVLTPTVTPGKQKKSVKVDVIGESYMTPYELGQTGKDAVDVLRPVLTAIRDVLKCIATLPDGVKTPWPWVA
jgi:hypothetical protein